jgi:hypothetical protein
VYNHPEFEEKIKTITENLHLKGHIVGLHPDGKGGIFMYGHGDLGIFLSRFNVYNSEGHVGTDGRMYLRNFAHFCPPEPPILENTLSCYRYLRPGKASKTWLINRTDPKKCNFFKPRCLLWYGCTQLPEG